MIDIAPRHLFLELVLRGLVANKEFVDDLAIVRDLEANRLAYGDRDISGSKRSSSLMRTSIVRGSAPPPARSDGTPAAS